MRHAVQRGLAYVLDARRETEPQQMHHAKNDVRVTMRVGRMDVALDDVVVHQAIDDVRGLLFGRTHDR